ncbi:hypothetical protein HDU86_007464 [Geranomyces michiganensis]|nr:hypothetical protein HDU86_007464 [Geranomyces michiganensis]
MLFSTPYLLASSLLAAMSVGVSAAPTSGPTEADLTAIRVAFLESAYNTTVDPSQVQDISRDAIAKLSAELAVEGQANAPPATFTGGRKTGFASLNNPQGAGPISALARTDVLRFQSYAASAYCLKWIFNKKWNCHERCTNGLTDGTVMQDYFNKDSSTGFVAYNDRQKQIVISFRGSLFPMNFYRDLQLLTAPLTIGSASAPADTRVHYGFQESYKVAQARVRAAVDTIRASNPARKDYTIVTTGHSLGGAVSVLAALDMRQRYPDAKVQGFTYGEPRVGNEVFAKWVDSLDMPITRVTAWHDPIPTVPRREWGLNYMHHNTETYITENHDNIVSCTEPANGDEPTNCLNGEPGLAGRDVASILTPIWIAWHLNYSNMIFGPWC